MVHLPVHLADEAMVGGPVQFRWMYPIEQYLHDLKSYVRNRTHPEASIAEGYIASECMTLCSRYLSGIQTKFNRVDRNYDGNDFQDFLEFSQVGRFLGSNANVRSLSPQELEQAHIYVMKNTEEVQPFLEEFSHLCEHDLLGGNYKKDDAGFISWFRQKVANSYEPNKSKRSNELLALSRGPAQSVKYYSGYVLNGFHFHTKDHDKNLRTQNYGVVVVGDDGVDVNAVDYYGVLREVIEL